MFLGGGETALMDLILSTELGRDQLDVGNESGFLFFLFGFFWFTLKGIYNP